MVRRGGIGLAQRHARKRRRTLRRLSTVAAVLALAGTGGYVLVTGPPDWLTGRAPERAPSPAPEAGPASIPAPPIPPDTQPPPTPEVAEETPLEPPLPPLADSDPLVRDLAHELSPHARFSDWLSVDGLMRRFVAVVENIADRDSPGPHVPFLAPTAKFSVIERDRDVYLDPKSYERYDAVGDVVGSVDPRAAVAFYRKLKPLCDDAYRELGYPDGRFEDALTRAVQTLLATPVIEGDVALRPKVVTYAFADRELEALRPAQKHFLRMGPRNVRVIQRQLRALAAELGMPESALPAPVTRAAARG